MLDQPEVSVSRRRSTSPVPLEVASLDVALVAVEGMLDLGRRLPLVAPDHVETGAIECEMEAADAGEELRGSGSATGLTLGRGVVWGHVGSLCDGRVRGQGDDTRSGPRDQVGAAS